MTRKKSPDVLTIYWKNENGKKQTNNFPVGFLNVNRCFILKKSHKNQN